MTAAQAAKDVATDVYNLGRSDAREWIKNPYSKPLACLRLEYQDTVVDACEWGTVNASSPHVTVAGLMEMLAIYGAGVDSPDVLGQLKDGRLLGVEVKAEKGRLRPEQAVFLERIRSAGGVAFMARDCRDVFRELDIAGGKHD
ncbi:VRR-NUC domain-containing protein [Actimicrobium sp. GrIS 1.19]|uniref:VRR-NUC domain-containing protein n=1 Tax=Actimicrobium sp. GrIS 1.19 TaxID=3071708 RepID=UPI002E0E4E3B